MRKVVDYTVEFVSNDDTKEDMLGLLAEMVKKRIAEGWEPLGGVAIVSTAENGKDDLWEEVAQAMVRYEEVGDGR